MGRTTCALVLVFILLLSACGRATEPAVERVIETVIVETAAPEEPQTPTAEPQRTAEEIEIDLAALIDNVEQAQLDEELYEDRLRALMDFGEDNAAASGAPGWMIAQVGEPLRIKGARLEGVPSSEDLIVDAESQTLIPLAPGELTVPTEEGDVVVDIIELPQSTVRLGLGDGSGATLLLGEEVVFDAYDVAQAFAEQQGWPDPTVAPLKMTWHFGSGSLHPVSRNGGIPDSHHSYEEFPLVAVRIPEAALPDSPYTIWFASAFLEDLGGNPQTLKQVTVYRGFGGEPPQLDEGNLITWAEYLQPVDPAQGAQYNWIDLREQRITEPMDLWLVIELSPDEPSDQALVLYADESSYRFSDSYVSLDGETLEYWGQGDFLIDLWIDKYVSQDPDYTPSLLASDEPVRDFSAVHTYGQEGDYTLVLTMTQVSEQSGGGHLVSLAPVSQVPFPSQSFRQQVKVRKADDLIWAIFGPSLLERLQREAHKRGYKITIEKLKEDLGLEPADLPSGQKKSENLQRKLARDVLWLIMGKKFGAAAAVDGLVQLVAMLVEKGETRCATPKELPSMISSKDQFKDSSDPPQEVNCLFLPVWKEGTLTLKIPRGKKVFMQVNKGRIEVETDNDGELVIYRNVGHIEVNDNNGDLFEVRDNLGTITIEPENDEWIHIKRNWGTVKVNETAHDNEEVKVGTNYHTGRIELQDHDNDLVVESNYGTIKATDNRVRLTVGRNQGGFVEVDRNWGKLEILRNTDGGSVVIHENHGACSIVNRIAGYPPGVSQVLDDRTGECQASP